MGDWSGERGITTGLVSDTDLLGPSEQKHEHLRSAIFPKTGNPTMA